MADQVVVLGSCGAWPEAGRACSGYLVSLGGRRIVLDLGYGTAARLFALLEGDVPDAVVITHAHPDHAVDLHALFRALHYGGHAGAVPVHAAPGVEALMAAMDPPDASEVASVLDFRALPASVGPVAVRPFALPHYVPNVGVRLEAGGLCVAYTGDTGPDPALAELARGADLFIADCTDRPPLNLGPREAAAAAAAGGARRLLLTHFWPGADREACRRAAANIFPGEILVAEEGLSIPLP